MIICRTFEQRILLVKELVKDGIDRFKESGLELQHFAEAVKRLQAEEVEKAAMTEPQKFDKINTAIEHHPTAYSRRIAAIKMVREFFGISLRESVDFVDAGIANGKIKVGK